VVGTCDAPCAAAASPGTATNTTNAPAINAPTTVRLNIIINPV
jgi:hypothetical protein